MADCPLLVRFSNCDFFFSSSERFTVVIVRWRGAIMNMVVLCALLRERGFGSFR